MPESEWAKFSKTTKAESSSAPKVREIAGKFATGEEFKAELAAVATIIVNAWKAVEEKVPEAAASFSPTERMELAREELKKLVAERSSEARSGAQG